MLKGLLLAASARTALRTAARWLFRVPLVGGPLRNWTHSVLPPGRTWMQLPNGPGKGIWMHVDPYWEEGYVRGCAESGVLEAIIEPLGPGSCFYDVGAHIGFYSLIAARIVGPAGCVLAIEPDPDNVAVLQEHLLRNGFSQVRIVQAAAIACDGEIAFRRSGGDAPTRMSGKVTRESAAAGSTDVVTTAAVCLDSLARLHPPPTVVKIDVEGEEIAVLEGARELLRDFHPVLVIEVHNEPNGSRMRKLLLDSNYHVEQIGSNSFQYPALFVARPENR